MSTNSNNRENYDYSSIRKDLNIFCQLKDPQLYKEYVEFNLYKKSKMFLIFSYVSHSLFVFPINTLSLISDLATDNNLTAFDQTISLVIYIVLFFAFIVG